MATTLAEIWRHPIKSLGAERVASVELSPGRTLPYDRTWALAHEKTRFDYDAPEWTRCTVFMRVAVAPEYAAVSASAGADGRLTLTHPKLEPITLDPDDAGDVERLVAWVRPISPDGPKPVRLAKVPGRGMTDSEFPSVSVMSLASLRALSERMGVTLNPRRFRGNLWVEGLAPWEEFDWVGREVTIGAAKLRIVEPIERCNTIKANPETGARDADALGALEACYGHKNFGVNAEVVAGGTIGEGAPVARV